MLRFKCNNQFEYDVNMAIQNQNEQSGHLASNKSIWDSIDYIQAMLAFGAMRSTAIFAAINIFRLSVLFGSVLFLVFLFFIHSLCVSMNDR